MMDYPGPSVVEIASIARHNGHGYAVEIFCIGSDQASVILVRKGLMRGAGLDTTFSDIQIVRGKWQKEENHYDAALREAAALLTKYNNQGHQDNFDDDPISLAYIVRVAGNIDKLHAEERKAERLRKSQMMMRLMNEDALAAMKRSAVESLTAQLLGIVKLKQDRETARQERDAQAKLHNVSLFMGQLAAIAERQTRTPDCGEW